MNGMDGLGDTQNLEPALRMMRDGSSTARLTGSQVLQGYAKPKVAPSPSGVTS